MMSEEEYEVGANDLEDARRVIRDSQTSADRLIRASRELEHIVTAYPAMNLLSLLQNTTLLRLEPV